MTTLTVEDVRKTNTWQNTSFKREQMYSKLSTMSVGSTASSVSWSQDKKKQGKDDVQFQTRPHRTVEQ
jgi:hypothetical protein